MLKIKKYVWARIANVFALDRSWAFLVSGNRAEALRRERAIKRRFADGRVDARSREWFAGANTEDVLAAVASFDDEKDLVVQTLREAWRSRPPTARSNA